MLIYINILLRMEVLMTTWMWTLNDIVVELAMLQLTASNWSARDIFKKTISNSEYQRKNDIIQPDSHAQIHRCLLKTKILHVGNTTSRTTRIGNSWGTCRYSSAYRIPRINLTLTCETGWWVNFTITIIECKTQTKYIIKSQRINNF